MSSQASASWIDAGRRLSRAAKPQGSRVVDPSAERGWALAGTIVPLASIPWSLLLVVLGRALSAT